MKPISHFKTIMAHKKLVMEGCFRLGLYYQGIMHDMSKLSPAEFFVGARYFQGFRSPNNAEREKYGYSKAWMHHKGRNKHHYEYWTDYSPVKGKGIVPARMPDKYIAEMFVDRVAASKNYNKEKYTDDMPLKYYMNGRASEYLEEHTRDTLCYLLQLLANEGEAACDEYIRKNLLKYRLGTMLAQYLAHRKE